MFATLALTLLASGAVAQQKVTPVTPSSLVQCQPALIKWEGGSPPYFVSFIPGKQPSAAPLVDFGTLNNNSLTWVVNQPAGTSLTLKVVDSTGADNFSSEVSVQKGANEDCMKEGGGGAAAGGDAAASGSESAGASDAAKPTESGAESGAATDKPAETSGSASPSGSAAPSGNKPSGSATSSGATAPSTTTSQGSGAKALGVSGALAAVAVVAAALF